MLSWKKRYELGRYLSLMQHMNKIRKILLHCAVLGYGAHVVLLGYAAQQDDQELLRLALFLFFSLTSLSQGEALDYLPTCYPAG